MLSTLFRISSILLLCTSVMANDIYITQSGDSLDLDIVQDGQNNQIEGLSGSGNAIIYGANSDVSLTPSCFAFKILLSPVELRAGHGPVWTWSLFKT